MLKKNLCYETKKVYFRVRLFYKILQACFISVTFIIRLNVLEKFINFLGHCSSNFR